MPKTDGDKTRKKLLQVSEELFSKYGFDGTSISMITKKANVNKALIYYHFSDKNDIILSLFKNILEELRINLSKKNITDNGTKIEITDITKKVDNEIQFLAKKSRIISIMLMEALKASDENNFLFECAKIITDFELNMKYKKTNMNENSDEYKKFIIFEFFTGFIPMINYIVLKEKFGEYFNIDEELLHKFYLESFQNTHLKNHL